MSETGVSMIASERSRQILVEGWTAEHDDEHEGCELARAAAVYTLNGAKNFAPVLDMRNPLEHWPQTWSRIWFKPKSVSSMEDTDEERTVYVRDLVKDGALIAAEIYRVLRLQE